MGRLRHKIKKFVKSGFQVLIWAFIFYMGINIITRGTKILYGKTIGEMIKEAAGDVTERLGVIFMKKTGFVFSYLYKEDEPETLASAIFKKTYLLAESGFYGHVYPDEDSIYKNIRKDFEAKKYEETSNAEDLFQATTVMPEYNVSGGGEGDINEAISTFVRAPAPDIIGNEYTLMQLENFDFLLGKFFLIDSNTQVNRSILSISKMMDADMTLKNNDEKSPQILIFHTHSQEAFADSRQGVLEDTVVGLGGYLAEILERDYGYRVLHITTTFDCIDGKIDRSKAYAYAQEEIEKILDKYPSIEVVLDIHRDGVNDDVHLVTEYNGKKTAKIMFVNGISRFKDGEISYLNNPNLSGNLAFSFQLQLKGEAYFPGFMRRTMIKAYRYNLHFRPKSALIEVGAQTNSVEEARNAMELLAVMLGEVLQ